MLDLLSTFFWRNPLKNARYEGSKVALSQKKVV